MLVVLAWDAGRRHIEIARKVQCHCSVQYTAYSCDAVGAGGPDPVQHLVNRVGEGEDVVSRLPIGVLVGGAETRHPERRPVSERSTKVRRRGACMNSRLEGVNDPDRIVTK